MQGVCMPVLGVTCPQPQSRLSSPGPLSHPQLKPTGVFYGAAESKMLHRSTEQNNRRNNVRGGGLSCSNLANLARPSSVRGANPFCCLSVRKGTPGGDDETAVFVTTRTSPRFPSLNSSRSSIFVEPVGVEGGGGCGYGAISATPSRRGKGPGRDRRGSAADPEKGLDSFLGLCRREIGRWAQGTIPVLLQARPRRPETLGKSVGD
jgi:hypothetical protein